MIYTKEEFKKEWEKEDCQITFDDCADSLQNWTGARQIRCHRPETCVYNCLIQAGMDEEAEKYYENNLKEN